MHTCILDGTKILRESWGDTTIVPMYDNEDSVCGIMHNGTPYYFIKNLQGDVIALTNYAGIIVAEYSYDARGKCTIDPDSMAYSIAQDNPYRYRCYYYDEEIELYYLQSRYYDPEVGRFVNADECVNVGISRAGCSHCLFSYCENNPICRVDTLGAFWLTLIVASVTLVYLGNNLVHYIYNQTNATSGFIYNQRKGKTANLRFGFFKSSFNGCGWIATYNALILLGKNQKLKILFRNTN